MVKQDRKSSYSLNSGASILNGLSGAVSSLYKKSPGSLEWSFGIFLLTVLCLNVWLLKLPDIDWGIALSGWSPLDWVAHLNHPENFVRDFPNGMHLYDKSSVMHLYPLAQQWFGISPDRLIPAMILCEIGFLAACAVYFCRVLVPASPPSAAILFAVLLISSSARSMELANFGEPYFWGLYYNFADGLRLLGIALFLQRRVVTAALLFAASLTVHPVMAAMAGAFTFGCLLAERRTDPRRLAVATVLAGAIVAVWWWFKFRNTDISSGAIDAQTWVSMARAFSFHFFPVDYGMLTVYHDTHILPLLCLMALASFYLPRVCKDDLRCRAILTGLLLMGVLTATGLLISVYLPIPALIKLALPRASDMLILIALAVAVAGLVADIISSHPLWRALAAAVLLSPFFMKPGFPAVPVLLLILLRTLHRQWVRPMPLAVLVSLAFGTAVVVLGTAFFELDLLKPHQLPAYIGSESFWRVAGIAALLAVFAWVATHVRRDGFNNGRIALIVLLFAVAYFSNLWQNQTVPIQQYRKRGEDYLEAQRWANTNTRPAALFMVDPTIYYGWRDFSSRSSFGNLREWLHTSWLYDSRITQYKEGKKRFDEFGIDLTRYLNETPPINGFYKLDAEVRRRFYGMSSHWFIGLADRYGIDYLVLSRRLIKQIYPFERVFENDSFVVYKLRQQTEELGRATTISPAPVSLKAGS